jgi:hypothetical protein
MQPITPLGAVICPGDFGFPIEDTTTGPVFTQADLQVLQAFGWSESCISPGFFEWGAVPQFEQVPVTFRDSSMVMHGRMLGTVHF